MYLAVYDLQSKARIFTHPIAYSSGTIAELRHLAISSDGNKIVAGQLDASHSLLRPIGPELEHLGAENGSGTWDAGLTIVATSTRIA